MEIMGKCSGRQACVFKDFQCYFLFCYVLLVKLKTKNGQFFLELILSYEGMNEYFLGGKYMFRTNPTKKCEMVSVICLNCQKKAVLRVEFALNFLLKKCLFIDLY